MDDEQGQTMKSSGKPRKTKPEAPERPKRSRGKPSLGDHARRIQITARITPIEAAQWKAEADAKGMSLASYVLSFIRQRGEKA